MSEASTILMRDLHAFIDRELDPDSMEAVAAHLADSAGDAARVAEWQMHAAEIRAAFDDIAHQPLPAALTGGPGALAGLRIPLDSRLIATAATFLFGLTIGFVAGFSL